MRKQDKMEKAPVIIVGAGLAGSLMAIYLAQKGLAVEIFESRPDMRTTEISAGRSINLALSDRGILPLEEVGLIDKIMAEAVKMPGRMLHAKDGALKFAPYGKDTSQYINSISRGGLNQLLMTEAEAYENVNIHFNQKCIDVNLNNKSITVEDYHSKAQKSIQGCTIIGGDGANSAVRTAMEQQIEGYNASVDWLEHGYKELSIPPMKDANFALEKNALHIWPRGNYMLIALPNADGSFTCTLFFPHKGNISFESLNTPEKVQTFFEEQFADAIPHLTNFQEEFANNPVGKLGTLKCYPWIKSDSAALIGDAAHAVVPFYGQGMNASFEDCRVLNACIEEHGVGNWTAAYEAYQKLRKRNGDAIGDLAVENFYEMRDHVADPTFRKKRMLEHSLENTYDDYHSKYSLVTFQPQISYAVAKKLGNQQDALLMDICKNVDDVTTLDVPSIYAQLKELKNQLHTTDKFMEAAINEAKKGRDTGGIPIGSVLVKDGKIIGAGHNQRVQQNDPMAHAEIDCLKQAGRVGSYNDTVLYSTLMPCYLCAGAVVQFGIKKVIVGENATFPGAAKFMKEHGVEIINTNNQECIDLMTTFIKQYPKLWNEDIGK